VAIKDNAGMLILDTTLFWYILLYNIIIFHLISVVSLVFGILMWECSVRKSYKIIVNFIPVTDVIKYIKSIYEVAF